MNNLFDDYKAPPLKLLMSNDEKLIISNYSDVDVASKSFQLVFEFLL